MTAAPSVAADARAVRRELAEAGDGKIMQVVRLVDGLAERGEADLLLAPVRDRLRVLRPARRMRLSRLLFVPLDPLIVGPKDWRPDTALIPRTALTPLSDVVLAAFGAAAPGLQQEIAAIGGTDAIAVRRLGATVWPRAAAALAAGEMPPSWTAQGLPAAAFQPLSRAVAFVLAAEVRLAEIERPSTSPELVDKTLGAVLTAAQQRGTQCWGMLLALLLQRFPSSAEPLRAATSNALDRTARQAAEAALALAASWIEAAAASRGPPDLATAGAEIARQVALLDALADVPARRVRANALRAALQAGCEARFEAGLKRSIDVHLNAPPDPELVAEMEQDARLLRQMEAEARRLGGGPAYDLQLREAAGRVLAADRLDGIDRVRLIEILGGTTLAMQAHRMLFSG